jgi:hypothetical protein
MFTETWVQQWPTSNRGTTFFTIQNRINDITIHKELKHQYQTFGPNTRIGQL